MVSFEQAFSDAERAAESVIKSTGDLARHARALKKAAQEGNVAGVKRAQSRIDDAVSALRQDALNTSSTWPFQEEDEKRYLDDQYADELRGVAEEAGLNIFERDGSLISYPSILRILPGDRAVRVDSKRVPTIRPSHLVGMLLKNQQKPLRRLPMSYLNALYAVYSDIVGEGGSHGQMSKGSGRVVPLARMYKLMTALPGSRREYSRTDFARDLYILDSDGPRRTNSGMVVSFPSSTGTRRRSDIFSFIGPKGDNVEYYGIRFAEDG